MSNLQIAPLGPQPYTAAELADYPQDVQEILIAQRATEIQEWNHYVNEYSHSERTETGFVVHYTKGGAIMDQGPIHAFFSLSYASWLCLPRVALQEMPPPWQQRLVDLLAEADDIHKMPVPDGLIVQRRIGARFASLDEWNNYRRGNTVIAVATDERNENR
ncbi:hypothetical protein BAJUN_00140 [Bajunvirus bajun]|uniref:Uncharacterized protein n=1 Tax=Brevundimonas phage vB_BgoS-Bajun TaxID=2948594 RepID=A0A9E7SRV5_9CAUD|nr:hypothetical protein BAJUN_00140 [Brevundimonas phage vB_BgoS-Bajun]